MKKSRSEPKYNWTGRVQLEEFIIPEDISDKLVEDLNIEDNDEKIIDMLDAIKLAVMMYQGFHKADKSAPKVNHVLAATKEVYDTATELLQLTSKLDDITNDLIFKNTSNLDENRIVIESKDLYIGNHLVTIPLSSGSDKIALNKELQSVIHSCLKTYEILEGKESRGNTEDTYFAILIQKLSNIFDQFFINLTLDDENTIPLKLEFIIDILTSANIDHPKNLKPYLS